MAKTFYFLYFGAMACLLPYLTLYYRDIGLSGREIGILTGIVPLIGMVGSAIWGMLADFTGRHRFLFLLAIISTWISVYLLTRAPTFLALIPVVIFYAVANSPIIPIVDNAVVEHWGKNEYGRQRVWGSYGWGLAGAAAGAIIASFGLIYTFFSYLVIFIPLVLVGARLPVASIKTGSNFWAELRQLLSQRPWLFFIAIAMIETMSLAIFINYLFLYLDTLGISARVMGLTLTMATISEVPIFLYSRRMLDRWSPSFLLAISLVFTLVRSFSYVSMTAPWQLLLVSLLHGPTFALMWVAGVAYSAEIAPPGLGTTAQSVFAGLVMGLGSTLGALFGGLLYDSMGPESVFYFAGFATLAATVLFIFVNRHSFLKQLQPAPGP